MEYLDWKAGGRGPAGMGVFSEIMMVSILCAMHLHLSASRAFVVFDWLLFS